MESPPPTSCKVCKPKPNGYWCIPCNRERFRQEFPLWTSGNEHIDKFIQTAQLEATKSEHVIEWIPFDRFENVSYIAKGGFGKVYKAKWKDGRISTPNPLKQLGWWRKSPIEVALKSLDKSVNVNDEFLNELKMHLKCVYKVENYPQIPIPLYGITQDPVEKNYMVVSLFASNGSMKDYMKKNLADFVWSHILLYLRDISSGLLAIHNAGLVHRDFHSGNILFERNIEYIADFGLTKSVESSDKNEVYGVVPYVAPEVLRGKAYTQASDIYSFGILMWEIVTCIPPYNNEAHGYDLIKQIVNGRRPEIDDEFPECYAQLMKECWSENPDNRPKTEDLYNRCKEFKSGYSGYIENSIYKDIFTEAQAKRKKFLEKVYEAESNFKIVGSENDKKDHDDDKNLNKYVNRYFTPPHPEAYTTSRLIPKPIDLNFRNKYRQTSNIFQEVKPNISKASNIPKLTEPISNLDSGQISLYISDSDDLEE